MKKQKRRKEKEKKKRSPTCHTCCIFARSSLSLVLSFSLISPCWRVCMDATRRPIEMKQRKQGNYDEVVREGEMEGGNSGEGDRGFFLSIYLHFHWTVFQVPWSSLIMSLYLSLFLSLSFSLFLSHSRETVISEYIVTHTVNTESYRNTHTPHTHTPHLLSLSLS